MKNAKLLSLLVVIATISPLVAHGDKYYGKDRYGDRYYDRRPLGRVGGAVEGTGYAAGNVVEGTGYAAGRAVEGAGEAAGNVIKAPFRIFGGGDRDYYND